MRYAATRETTKPRRHGKPWLAHRRIPSRITGWLIHCKHHPRTILVQRHFVPSRRAVRDKCWGGVWWQAPPLGRILGKIAAGQFKLAQHLFARHPGPTMTRRDCVWLCHRLRLGQRRDLAMDIVTDSVARCFCSLDRRRLSQGVAVLCNPTLALR